MQNLASASDIKILQACADEDRQKILLRLIRSPATQKELTAELRLNSGTVSRHMKVLKDAELVLRTRSHDPYTLSVSEETWQLLRATTNVSQAITQRRTHEIDERSKEVQRAVMRPAEEPARSEDA